MDFTLSNQKIKRYLDGVSDVPPSAETLYIHKHALKGTFLTQIEYAVLQLSMLMEEKPREGILNRMRGLSVSYAKYMGKLDEKSVDEFLEVVRDIYGVCKNVLSKEGIWEF